MNKIYKIIKSKTTGILTVVSELAKGAKKGSVAKLAIILSLSITSANALAATGITSGYNPAVNDNKLGSTVISGSNKEIDLGIGNGFNDAAKGDEVNKHTIVTDDSVSSLYKIKYQDVAEANTNLQNALQYGADQSVIDSLTQILTDKQNAAALISDDKFKVNDPNNLIGKNTEATRISETTTKYKDPVTDKTFEITVKGSLVKTQAGSQVTGGIMNVDFYEKTSQDSQYSNMEMVEVNGSATDVTISNTGDQKNGQLTAISKKGSGVIKVNDGANLTFDTDASYYTGGGKSTSQPFEDKEKYTSTSQQTLYEVKFKVILAKKVDRCCLYDINENHRRKHHGQKI